MNKFFLFFILFWSTISLYANTPLSHIVILGDPHIPGKHLEAKESVLQTINQWNDVSMVVAVGDLCSQTATKEEYAAVKTYFQKLSHPLYPITGNHDYIYADALDVNGKLQHASIDIQQEKLEFFRYLFNLPKLYYSFKVGPYKLIFLSIDNPKHLAGLSSEQLMWFENELKIDESIPTIIFFHAPLQDTLETYKHWVNTPSFIAQPVNKIKTIIENHPQIFLWVSGHTHTSPKETSFASAINVYENQVTNIHNTDMNKETIWTNSLFLYDDKIVIKTYNHNEQKWLDSVERIIYPPKLR